MNKIIVLNGPNLNLLGEREKKQYGSLTLKEIENNCKEFANKNNIKLSLFQSNIEGKLITLLLENEPLGSFTPYQDQIDFAVAYGTIDAID